MLRYIFMIFPILLSMLKPESILNKMSNLKNQRFYDYITICTTMCIIT